MDAMDALSDGTTLVLAEIKPISLSVRPTLTEAQLVQQSKRNNKSILNK